MLNFWSAYFEIWLIFSLKWQKQGICSVHHLLIVLWGVVGGGDLRDIVISTMFEERNGESGCIFDDDSRNVVYTAYWKLEFCIAV